MPAVFRVNGLNCSVDQFFIMERFLYETIFVKIKFKTTGTGNFLLILYFFKNIFCPSLSAFDSDPGSFSIFDPDLGDLIMCFQG